MNNTIKVVLKEAGNIIMISVVWLIVASVGAIIMTPIAAMVTGCVVKLWKVFYNLVA